MTSFTITEVSSRTRDWTGQGNSQNRSYYVKCQGDDKVYELAQKADREPPKPGDTLDANVEERVHDGTTFYKLKRIYQNNGRGGPRYSAEDIARMEGIGRIKGRCHAQGVAAQMLGPDLANVNFNDGAQANAFLTGVFKPLVDWLVTDAQSARDAA